MDSCFYCEKDERLLALMTPVCELDYTNIYLFNNQLHRGRCVIAFKEHKTEIFQLSEEEREGFFSEVAKAAQIVMEYTGADKLNYAIYGDLVSHFHLHMVPKYKEGPQWGEAFADKGAETVTLGTEQFDKILKDYRLAFANLKDKE